MEKVDFCFLVTETSLDPKIKILVLRELEKRGFSSFFITTSEMGDRILREAGLLNFQNLDLLSEKIEIKNNELGQEIERAEAAFAIPSVRTEVLTEKLVFHIKDEKKILKTFLRYLLVLKEFFDTKLKAKYFVQGISGSLNSRAFYYTGKGKGTHVFFSPSPFCDDFNFSLHPWGILETKKEEIDQFELDEKSRESISDYIKKRKQEKKLSLFLTFQEINPYITKKRFKVLFSLIKNYKVEKLQPVFIFKNFWKRFFRKFYVRKFYSKPEPGEKYIFFPLHFPDDSQLVLRAVPFISQEFLIEILCRYLPFGYKIYVKEHPAALGSFSKKMLEFINKLPNVKIVPPDLNPHDLIKKAEIVCVINSTVGFEALMYQKPVITFGESFYARKGVTLDVDNLYEVPEIIKKAHHFRPDWNKILLLFSLWRKKGFPPSPQEYLDIIDSAAEKKIALFCDSLLKYLNINNKKREKITTQNEKFHF